VPTEVVIPAMGLTMEEGSIVEWLKNPGDSVTKGEPLFTVQTDKAVLDVPSPASGVLAEVRVPPGQAVPVGMVVAVIGSGMSNASELGPGSGTEAVATLDSGTRAEPAPASRDADPLLLSPPRGPDPTRRVRSSPAARRLARERGVDINTVTGTGPGGRVVAGDIPQRAAQVPTIGVPLTRTRQATAAKMVEAWGSVPMVTLFMPVGMRAAVELYTELKAAWKQEADVDLRWDAVMIRAVALALRQHPVMNARWTGTAVELFPAINVRFAVATSDGLTAPVVRAADGQSLLAIARDVARLAAAVKSGRLAQADHVDGTFTVTNLGGYGVTRFTPIVNTPEAGILGVGAITERLQLVGGQATTVPQLELSLTFDHRVVDGAPAADFLGTVRALLEAPYRLLT
jgi:pyruvate dehydrogenase E2 component (dihydrolipoamide acetyltransferase)